MNTSGDSEMVGLELLAHISSLAEESMSHDVDLLAEILQRLPSKSLMRFKSVCKSWHALITSRYFCFLWRRHHDQVPGILLTSLIIDRQHGYVPLSGPRAGVLQLEIPRNLDDLITESCDGFLLRKFYDYNAGITEYWIHNPATREVVVLPPLRMDSCKIHALRCSCVFKDPILAFDSHSRRKLVSLARHQISSNPRYICQVCVMENRGGGWTSSSEPFESCATSVGMHWRNFVVWVSRDKTLFYDVEGGALRFCDSPDGLTTDYFSCFGSMFSHHLEESGGHLHFFRDHQGSSLIIDEMKHDLSGWLVKHKIMLSQIEASLSWSIGWNSIAATTDFIIHFLMEEKDQDSMLVLGCLNDVVLYRIRDHKSWKLCQWDFTENSIGFLPGSYFPTLVHQHVETISRFHHQD